MLSEISLAASAVLSALSLSWIDPGLSIPFNNDSGMIVGRGYYSSFGAVRADCVKPSPLIPARGNPDSLPSQSMELQISEISSYEDLLQKLDLDIKGSMSTLAFNASAEVSYLKSNHFNTRDYFLLFKVKVINQSQTMQTLELSNEAVGLLNRDPHAFLESCGDQFFYSIKTGGEFYAILRIGTSSQTDRSQLTMALGGGTLMWNTTATSTIMREITHGQRQVDFKVIRAGDTQGLNVQLENVIEYGLSFSEKVKADGGRPWPLSLSTMSYGAIAAKDERVRNAPLNMGPSQEVFQTMRSDYLKALEARNNLEFILHNPGRFEAFDAGQMRQRLVAASSRVTQIMSNATQCLRDLPEPCEIHYRAPAETELYPRRKACREVCLEEANRCNPMGQWKHSVQIPFESRVHDYFQSCDLFCQQNPLCLGKNAFHLGGFVREVVNCGVFQQSQPGRFDFDLFDATGCRGQASCLRSENRCVYE